MLPKERSRVGVSEIPGEVRLVKPHTTITTLAYVVNNRVDAELQMLAVSSQFNVQDVLDKTNSQCAVTR